MNTIYTHPRQLNKIHVSSVNNVNYKDFEKAILGEKSGQIIYLDRFSLKEALDLASIWSIDENDMMFRYQVFQGVARYLVAEDAPSDIDSTMRPLVEEAMNEYFGDQKCEKVFLKEAFPTTWMNAVSIISDALENV